eukprot:CAMPEP_0170508464 /NCGR_PEP_ID=MMETSP0208-20121228/62373_1 /TAXON_ID=197538 /ORGANISM="Strombidium inclinatum, Strain S3" /LENGTH=33 /DNA_ID= /DNA_START= /DNA_END= /DNA_ORIENTATION=
MSPRGSKKKKKKKSVKTLLNRHYESKLGPYLSM